MPIMPTMAVLSIRGIGAFESSDKLNESLQNIGDCKICVEPQIAIITRPGVKGQGSLGEVSYWGSNPGKATASKQADLFFLRY
ncbi:hypothetical protein SAMN05444166_0787 [Singulisphaera sp. GP187]|nr:hypothetical protein SAMN05444166_0787 [Singulisphaera sp. GP187]